MMKKQKVTLAPEEARRRLAALAEPLQYVDETDLGYVVRQVRQLCAGYGISQSALARTIGDHPSEISRLIRGVPGRSMMATFGRLRALGVEIPSGLTTASKGVAPEE